MTKRILTLAAATCFLALAVPAVAQINPFRNSRSEVKLSATDLDLLSASVDRLNRASNIAPGMEDKWSNPATGSYGTSTVTRIFAEKQRPCHELHHEVSAAGRTPVRNYELTWCRASDGKWKIKS